MWPMPHFLPLCVLLLRTNPDWYGPGEEVVISAEVDAPTGTVSVERVEAEIYDSDRQREVISLQPVRGTGGASPLRFEGRYRAPAQGGYYVILARAMGRSGGCRSSEASRPYSACAATGHPYSGVSGLLPSWLTERVLDLEATVHVDVAREGEYLCSVSLLDGTGNKVAALARTAHLQPGKQVMRITIPWGDVCCLQAGWPLSPGRCSIAGRLGSRRSARSSDGEWRESCCTCRVRTLISAKSFAMQVDYEGCSDETTQAIHCHHSGTRAFSLWRGAFAPWCASRRRISSRCGVAQSRLRWRLWAVCSPKSRWQWCPEPAARCCAFWWRRAKRSKRDQLLIELDDTGIRRAGRARRAQPGSAGAATGGGS